jgi:hypothetical protein
MSDKDAPVVWGTTLIIPMGADKSPCAPQFAIGFTILVLSEGIYVPYEHEALEDHASREACLDRAKEVARKTEHRFKLAQHHRTGHA